MRRFMLSLGLVMGLVACGTLEKVDTVAEKLSAAEASFTAAVETATKAYDQGLIEPASTLDKALDVAIESGNTALDVAQEFYKDGEPGTALEWVNRVTSYTDEIVRLVSKARQLVKYDTYWMEAAA